MQPVENAVTAVVEPKIDATRFRLDIAYDGSGFTGWARQPGLRTVQGEIEAALATALRRVGDPPSVTVAGRTDAGVHATGQVAHVDLSAEQIAALAPPHRGKGKAPERLPAGAVLARRINGIAAERGDLVVTKAVVAPDGFDARFSAVWRKYEYRVSDAAERRNPLERGFTVWHPSALDERAMDAAARALVGLNDFAAFCKPRDGSTSVRTLQRFEWTRGEDGVLLATVQADAFCHSMVRALVGATVAVGEGALEPSRLVELLGVRARTSEFKVFPAKGLVLIEVGYPPDAELAARAEQTRARRDPLPD